MPQLRVTGRAVRLDPLSAVLVTVASRMLIYPLVEGHELGWPAWTFVMMAGALGIFGLFCVG